MAIELEEIANGLIRFRSVFPPSLRFRTTLEIIDPDGDVDTRTFEWQPPEGYDLREAIGLIAEGLDNLPHIRAVPAGDELSIGAASDDYAVIVTAELVETP